MSPATERGRASSQKIERLLARPPLPGVPDGPGHGLCCWPISHDRPWRFCPNKRLPGRAYCAEHHRIAYTGDRELPFLLCEWDGKRYKRVDRFASRAVAAYIAIHREKERAAVLRLIGKAPLHWKVNARRG